MHARPYALLPTGRSRRLPVLGTLLGRVTKANWERLVSEELGDCHAWYYHQDRLLILWDCLVSEPAKDPRTDQIYISCSSVFYSQTRFLGHVIP